ncbi:MAG: nicotinamide mononucleotide transporter [Idiomarina sp.]|nr:nicotinamide mononucleotide transporter [Idiomarina sp.]
MQWMIDLLALTSGWELLAVLLAIVYVLFAIRQSLWCWPAAAMSASIYTMLFLQGGLYMESLLQVFYVVMAGYGYYQWTRVRHVAGSPTQAPVRQFQLSWHLRWIAAIVAATLIIGWLLSRYTQAELVWLDTPTTLFSLFATFLVARKALENWLYWIVIDITYVALFWVKGFYPTAILFAIYTVMALIGYIKWKKDYQQQEVAGEPCIN